MFKPLCIILSICLTIASTNAVNSSRQPINPRLLTQNVKVGEIPKPTTSLDVPQKFEISTQQQQGSSRFSSGGHRETRYPANKFVVTSECTNEPRKIRRSTNCTLTRYQGDDFSSGQSHCDLKFDLPEGASIVHHDPAIVDFNRVIVQLVEKTPSDGRSDRDSGDTRTTLHLAIVDFGRCADTQRIDLPIEILSHRLLSRSQGQDFVQLFRFKDSFEVILRNASGSSGGGGGDQILKLSYDYCGNPIGQPTLFPKFTALDLEHVLPVDEESPSAGYHVFATGRLVQVGADGWARQTKTFHEANKEFRDAVYSGSNGLVGRCTSGDRQCLQFDARNNLTVLANFSIPDYGEVQKQRGIVPVALKAMHNTRDGLILGEAVRYTNNKAPGDDLGYLLFRKLDRQGRAKTKQHAVQMDYKFIDNDAGNKRRLRARIYQVSPTDERNFQLLAIVGKKSSVQIAAEPETFA